MKTIDIAFKDLVRSTRNFFLIGMAIAAPLVITMLMYFAFGSLSSGDVSMTAIKVGVVNMDVLPVDAPLDAPIGDSIRSMFFDDSVKSWITASDYADEASARAAVDAQEIGVAVIIPTAFTEEYLAGSMDTAIVILQDPTLTIGPTVVRDMVTSFLDGVAGGGVAYQTINEQVNASGKTLDPASVQSLFERYADWYVDFQRAMFHTPEKAALVVISPTAGQEETSNSVQSMMGTVMVGQLIFFSFFTGAYAMMSILQESEEGTLARMFTTPTDRTTILAGKFLAVLFTVMLQGAVLLIAGHYLFKIIWGEPGSVMLSFIGQMFGAVGLAVLLVSFVKTTKQSGPVFGGALTVMGMLSGLFTTNLDVAIFDTLGKLTPQGWTLEAWTRSLAGAPPNELFVPFVVLMIMGTVMFIIGAATFRRRFA